MPATVFCNFRTVVHRGSGDTSFAFPDVCMTPAAPSPIPIPYPNIAQSNTADRTATTVLADGNPIMVKDSHYAMSSGDEAGCAPGNVVTGVIKGKAYFIMYSFDVKAEGKNVCRFLDPMTHNHSSSPPPGTPPGPDVGGTVGMPTMVEVKKDLIAGRITKVTCESGIPLESKGIKGRDLLNVFPAGDLPPSGEPNWKSGPKGRPPIPPKCYPAVYTIEGGGSDKKVIVNLEITELDGKFEGKKAQLFGLYLGHEIRADSPVTLSKGMISNIICQFKTLPKKTTYKPGAAINWFLKVEGLAKPVSVRKTHFEIFFLKSRPQSPWTGKPWYEALRYAFRRLNTGERKDNHAIVSNVTSGIHGSGLHYDTVRGGSSFGWGPLGGGAFYLSAFLNAVKVDPRKQPEAARTRLNCYDCAALVTVFSALMGVPGMRLIYLGDAPCYFGCINPTALIGVAGSCNNPFYDQTPGLPPLPLIPRKPDGSFDADLIKLYEEEVKKPLVSQFNPYRTWFGNHAFTSLNMLCYDACAGPYRGAGPLPHYVDASVDSVANGYFLKFYQSVPWTWELLIATQKPPRPISGVV